MSGACTGGDGGDGGGAGKNKRAVFAFWDTDNCSFPKKGSLVHIPLQIEEALERIDIDFAERVVGPISMQLIGDRARFGKKKVAQWTGMYGDETFFDVKAKDYPDRSDRVLDQTITEWADTNEDPAIVVILSGDQDFGYITNYLQHRHHLVVGFGRGDVTSPLIGWAADALFDFRDVCDRATNIPGLPLVRHHIPRRSGRMLKWMFDPIWTYTLDWTYVWWDFQSCPLPKKKSFEEERFEEDFDSTWKKFMKLGLEMMDELNQNGIFSRIRIFLYANFKEVELPKIYGFQDGAMRMRQVATGHKHYVYDALRLDLIDFAQQCPGFRHVVISMKIFEDEILYLEAKKNRVTLVTKFTNEQLERKELEEVEPRQEQLVGEELGETMPAKLHQRHI